MKIDIHCHAVATSNHDLNNCDKDFFFNWDAVSFLKKLGFKATLKKAKSLGDIGSQEKEISTDEFFNIVTRQLYDSNFIDKLVLLGTDAIYTEGEIDKRRTLLYTPIEVLNNRIIEINQSIKEKAKLEPRYREKQLLFGPSVNPNRPDWKEQLNYVINNTNAVLIKWIPSSHNINPATVDPMFYKMMADNGLPLLIHSGDEHTFPDYDRISGAYNHPDLLEVPLKNGLDLIIAHCGTRIFPWETNVVADVFKLLDKYPNKIWMDNAAFSSMFKTIPFTSEGSFVNEVRLEIIKRNFKLINGSDFPLILDGWTSQKYCGLTKKGYKQLKELIREEKNYFDQDILIKWGNGFQNLMLDRVEELPLRNLTKLIQSHENNTPRLNSLRRIFQSIFS